MSTISWGFPNQEAVTSNQLGGIQQYKEGIITTTEILSWSGGNTFTDLIPTTSYPNIIIVNKLILECGVDQPGASNYVITPDIGGDDNNIYINAGIGQWLVNDYLLSNTGGGQATWSIIGLGGALNAAIPVYGYMSWLATATTIGSTSCDYLKIGLTSNATITGDAVTGATLKYKLWYQIHQLG